MYCIETVKRRDAVRNENLFRNANSQLTFGAVGWFLRGVNYTCDKNCEKICSFEVEKCYSDDCYFEDDKYIINKNIFS